ncbi:PREDICTED: pentatricopeptide repeat-containing protein At5g47360 [Nelumbo nucifera]|uniref:Pentatricopeptide repeat-containing protein At5g47360 n=1 Tax=Nelumbo nucifera TaxID=4432 RepID=A0A1U7Z4M3_NELNU|nr:PREDICTED: pentatricopeptide repeat-containing protein At5g47360 [Nelumbo nucifera]
MAIRSICRCLLISYHLKNPRFLVAQARPFASSLAAENYWNLLQSNTPGLNLERSLVKIRAKLDSSCVEDVLRRCSVDHPTLGLRFFVWAGLQSDYRHSSFMYRKACELFEIHGRSQSLYDVLECYRKEGSFVSVKLFKVILNLCREANIAEEALRVLRKMGEFNCRPDTACYNIVIRLFCEKCDMDVAMELMNEMAFVDIYPDMVTYVEMIKGFCSAQRVEDACGLFRVMRGHGCFPNVVAYSALLDGICKIGNLERTFELLEEMEKVGGDCLPNVVTYTSVIQSFCQNGRSIEAMGVIDRMKTHGCYPNRITLSILVTGLCKGGHIEEAYKLIDKIIAEGGVSCDTGYSSLVVSLLRIKNIVEAEKVFRRMLASGLKPDGLACNSLMKELCLLGRSLDCFGFHQEMEKKDYLSPLDSDTYSILLMGLCREGHLVEATELVGAMVEKKVQLKGPYIGDIVELLKKSGQRELALHVASIRG